MVVTVGFPWPCCTVSGLDRLSTVVVGGISEPEPGVVAGIPETLEKVSTSTFLENQQYNQPLSRHAFSCTYMPPPNVHAQHTTPGKQLPARLVGPRGFIYQPYGV